MKSVQSSLCSLVCPLLLVNPECLRPDEVERFQRHQHAFELHLQTLTAQGAVFITGRVLLRVGDLTLDPFTRIAQRGPQTIALPPREFTLLALLMRNKGKPCSREQILAAWGYTYDPGTKLVEVTVNRLRAKLDAGFPTKLIQNVRCEGYRLKG